MFYYEEEVKQEHVSEVFDNLENIVNAEESPEAEASEEKDGGEQ